MRLRRLLYPLYERQLVRALDPERIPQHVGIILDGNRRWARSVGARVGFGHRIGANKIAQFLGWCEEAGVKHVTLWLLSTENFTRDENEIHELVDIISQTVSDLAREGRWQLHAVGALDLLPAESALAIKSACDESSSVDGMQVNVAIGYGGRREISDAVRSLLHEQLESGHSLEEALASVDQEAISRHLYTAGQPDPDLVIRTSGEQRLGGFLLWQSVHSEFYFCEAYWPDFRRVDFLRALRSYAIRQRRFGA
jgi:short-chain Z-isoprenyl diphosphate synthase